MNHLEASSQYYHSAFASAITRIRFEIYCSLFFIILYYKSKVWKGLTLMQTYLVSYLNIHQDEKHIYIYIIYLTDPQFPNSFLQSQKCSQTLR